MPSGLNESCVVLGASRSHEKPCALRGGGGSVWSDQQPRLQPCRRFVLQAGLSQHGVLISGVY